ncbi:peroxidase-like [Rhopalosiphum padi]|uniref:peroxidase-like n=1 Tax=Rhopalosiphum padi TaxID=40932 RepID=UPI00298E430F|nr:peroxidase-like [Rhopalosiphum padi]
MHKLNYYFRHGISDRQCARDLSNVNLKKTSLIEMCFSEYYNLTECTGRNLTFRSADGSCNNLKRTYLGKATTAYKRLMFPAYTDGIKDISEELPNPRKISMGLVGHEQSPDDIKSMAMAYWGIFIGHDLSRTAVSSMGTNNTFVRCCNNNGSLHIKVNEYVKSCNPIIIPDDDEFYGPKLQSCMNYVRSVPAMRPDCTFGPMEQMNQATHYLDGSMIYGSSVEQTMALRTMKGGSLNMEKFVFVLSIPSGEENKYSNFKNRTVIDPPSQTLSYMPVGSEACQYGNGTCYKAGDTRANSLPQLTVLYTLWARQHNEFARELERHNGHWNDERIFQESRKLVVACIQHITYNEWLPALLGENYTRQNGLEMVNDWFYDTYDETIDPTVSNSFATAILPFANSMLSDNISLYTENRQINRSFSLKEHYNRPMYIVRNYTDELIRGLTTQNAQKVDMLFTPTITNYLYSTHPDDLFGMDFISLAIQRSRDHGIPNYNKFRKYCGLKEIENIQDLSQIMVEGSVDKLIKQYKTWNHIDLLIGALLEKHAEGSMVGPTMRCMIRDQFVRTRAADRYFYNLPNVFPENQLEQIKSYKLATLFCHQGNNITRMQNQAFLIPSSTNELNNCNSIKDLDMGQWLEMAVTTEQRP